LLGEVNDRRLGEPQIRERNAHLACERRHIYPLDLYAETAVAVAQQQIEQRHPDGWRKTQALSASEHHRHACV
jgi:hypothetical protein